MPSIQEYHFGSITIDGKTYNRDVEVRWTGEVLPWQRTTSHIVDVEDVEMALSQNPEVIIIGTGEAGVAQVTEQAQKAIGGKGIKLIIDKTAEAVRSFNIINKESERKDGKKTKAIALFHLTC